MDTRDWREKLFVRLASAVFVVLALLILVVLMVEPGWAQGKLAAPGYMRNSGLDALVDGFRYVVGVGALIMAVGVLAYYHWKIEVRDIREAAWLAVAWCAVLYVLR